jgi:hypothetical protein
MTGSIIEPCHANLPRPMTHHLPSLNITAGALRHADSLPVPHARAAAPKHLRPRSPSHPTRARATPSTTRADLVRACQRRANCVPVHKLGRRERVRVTRPLRALGRHYAQPPDNVIDAARRGRRFRHGRHGAAHATPSTTPMTTDRAPPWRTVFKTGTLVHTVCTR